MELVNDASNRLDTNKAPVFAIHHIETGLVFGGGSVLKKRHCGPFSDDKRLMR